MDPLRTCISYNRVDVFWYNLMTFCVLTHMYKYYMMSNFGLFICKTQCYQARAEGHVKYSIGWLSSYLPYCVFCGHICMHRIWIRVQYKWKGGLTVDTLQRTHIKGQTQVKWYSFLIIITQKISILCKTYTTLSLFLFISTCIVETPSLHALTTQQIASM